MKIHRTTELKVLQDELTPVYTSGFFVVKMMDELLFIKGKHTVVSNAFKAKHFDEEQDAISYMYEHWRSLIDLYKIVFIRYYGFYVKSRPDEETG